MTDDIELTDEERHLLWQVDERSVMFTRGKYLLRTVGMPDVSAQIQRLRALGLVRLARPVAGQRMRPSRDAEVTELGRKVLDRA